MPRLMTRRQRETLTYIRDRDLPPTYREIGDALGISSTNQVAEIVTALVTKGYLNKGAPYLSRQLTVTRSGKVALTKMENEGKRPVEEGDDT